MPVEGTQTGDERGDLAAEYALGVLDLAGRLEAQRRIAIDPEFATEVASWEETLHPMAEACGEETPPPHLRRAVEERLFGASARQGGFWHSLGAWRSMALACLALLVVSAGLNARSYLLQEEVGARLIVSLEPQGGEVRFLALYEPGRSEFRLSQVSGSPGAGRDFELWLVEGGNPPVSLGVLPKQGVAEIDLPPLLARRVKEGATLAISDEPAGGSPTGKVTGPVVAAGSARPI